MNANANEMEGELFEAALEGNLASLLNLLQQNAQLLDRFVTSNNHPQTPLHVASKHGHIDFVDAILTRKPELANELDSQISSPLHLATAEGHLCVVKRLLQVNPGMCFVYNLEGRSPLHIAAIKGHIEVLRELVQGKPLASRLPMDKGETILHASVRYNQLEALKLLVEEVLDHEFVNRKNYDGNTILHLAVAGMQTEVINYLISSTSTAIEVNCRNENGFTALDLLSLNERNLRGKEIVESLRRKGAVRAKDKRLSNRQLKAIRTEILSSSSAYNNNQTDATSKPKKSKARKRNKYADWLERTRNALMLVASLLATMAFQVGVNPPGGLWQDSSDNHTAGNSIMADTYPSRYGSIYAYNTIGFVSSLSIILLLVSGLPIRQRPFMWILMFVTWLAIFAMALTYLLTVSAFTTHHQKTYFIILFMTALLFLLLLVHIVRLVFRFIKFLWKQVIRLMNSMSIHRELNV